MNPDFLLLTVLNHSLHQTVTAPHTASYLLCPPLQKTQSLTYTSDKTPRWRPVACISYLVTSTHRDTPAGAPPTCTRETAPPGASACVLRTAWAPWRCRRPRARTRSCFAGRVSKTPSPGAGAAWASPTPPGTGAVPRARARRSAAALWGGSAGLQTSPEGQPRRRARAATGPCASRRTGLAAWATGARRASGCAVPSTSCTRYSARPSRVRGAGSTLGLCSGTRARQTARKRARQTARKRGRRGCWTTRTRRRRGKSGAHFRLRVLGGWKRVGWLRVRGRVRCVGATATVELVHFV